MDTNEGTPGRARHGSPIFYKLLEEMAETHDAKSHDYANNNAPFANYEFAGTLASMFSHSSIDAGFVGRLGEKIYRLHVLESSGKIPLNESIADTERDIAVIATLWMAARKDERHRKWQESEIRHGLDEKSINYGVGERYPGPPNALGCDERGAANLAKEAQPAAQPHDPNLFTDMKRLLWNLTRVERVNLIRELSLTI